MVTVGLHEKLHYSGGVSSCLFVYLWLRRWTAHRCINCSDRGLGRYSIKGYGRDQGSLGREALREQPVEPKHSIDRWRCEYDHRRTAKNVHRSPTQWFWSRHGRHRNACWAERRKPNI